MTTGEGGMIVTNDDSLDFRARAYHDHGHENNQNVKRWEDTRHGSGFNYRMTEMQGAFGLAQLRKLDLVIARQREIKQKIDQLLTTNFANGLKLRPVRPEAFESADAAVFNVESAEKAMACRTALLDEGVGTKILPEAITWHFAGTWSHIPQLVSKYPNLRNECLPSESILTRCVALPITLNPAADFGDKIVRALTRVFNR
jgi:8-amino-3,8-dideoxy-alpha-D-manno-octulosonate transaminase